MNGGPGKLLKLNEMDPKSHWVEIVRSFLNKWEWYRRLHASDGMELGDDLIRW